MARDLMNKLRKPINRKPNKGKGPEIIQGDNPFTFEIPPFGTAAASGSKPIETEDDNKDNDDKDLLATSSLFNNAKNNNQKSTALYCQAHIKNKEISLIVDSGSSGCIMSAALMEVLEIECDAVSNTVMVNVNGERRRPLEKLLMFP